MITESTHLDIYWADTVRDIISANTAKRKFDYMLSQEASTVRHKNICQMQYMALTTESLFHLVN